MRSALGAIVLIAAQIECETMAHRLVAGIGRAISVRTVGVSRWAPLC